MIILHFFSLLNYSCKGIIHHYYHIAEGNQSYIFSIISEFTLLFYVFMMLIRVFLHPLKECPLVFLVKQVW